ncbi:hypothetical protein LshimejAT787_1202470 [Lyophyllum shimeji]|uniref:Uncharacterized protein n=1 Tax=Lyophyllum shimeji TaxID=47721 RepID=A0A9P3PWC6_LYOSH|nr:hypothetical protein LshimejAT787_1202470 [Lyophyllum shimeji]
MPNSQGQNAGCAPQGSTTHQQLPPGQPLSHAAPSARKARPPTLTELVTTHTRLSAQLTNIIQSSLSDLQADARALELSLRRRVKAAATPGTSAQIPTACITPANGADAEEVSSPDHSTPELSALLKRHAKYTMDVVGTLKQLNNISWHIGTVGWHVVGGSPPLTSSSIALQHAPSHPPAAASVPAGSSLRTPVSRPFVPLPSFPPSAAGSAQSLPPGATLVKLNGTSSAPFPAPPPPVVSIDPVETERCHFAPVPSEDGIAPSGSLLFAPEQNSPPAPNFPPTAAQPVPPAPGGACAPLPVTMRPDSYIALTTNITQDQPQRTEGMLGDSSPPQAKKHPSIPDLFPLLEPSLLSAITRHDLPPTELWQLDTRASATDRNANLNLLVPSTSTAVPNASAKAAVSPLQRFPTLNSLLIPLTTYFRVLHASVSSALTAAFSPMVFLSSYANPDATPNPTGPDTLRVVTDATQAYVAHLLDLEEQYEWDAVLAYHLAFHERRRVAMAVARGSDVRGCGAEGFKGWGVADGELIALYLFGREKNSARGMMRCGAAGVRTSNGVTAAGSSADSKVMEASGSLGLVTKSSTGTETTRSAGSEKGTKVKKLGSKKGKR